MGSTLITWRLCDLIRGAALQGQDRQVGLGDTRKSCEASEHRKSKLTRQPRRFLILRVACVPTICPLRQTPRHCSRN